MIFFADLEMAFGVFTNQEAIPEAPLGGASGPLQAPSTYVCDRRYIARFPTMFPPPQPGFFMERLPARQAMTDVLVAFGDFSYLSSLCGACRWSLFFFLGLFTSPKPIWKGPPRTVFINQQVMSLIQPRPALTDGLEGTKFSSAATNRKR